MNVILLTSKSKPWIFKRTHEYAVGLTARVYLLNLIDYSIAQPIDSCIPLARVDGSGYRVERSGNMKQLNNYAYIGTCDKCHNHGAAHTITEQGEMAVCYHCGNIIFNQKFDALRFMTDLVHEGITNDEGLQEQLEAALSDKYSWLEGCDLEALAGVLVRNLADEARFTAEDEDMEAVKDFHDMQHDYRSLAVGVA